ncbi:hypothetical protein [Oceanobacillus indicireducens]|uniref:Uncharacterized protein n=1 Tax=Oceanobacillus indicireducens TaxID=1004261 RepID=A0A917Y2S8_9BACI|nr:hypothetical protein [Oceanobacillus indicireducens]GGN64545.1 hypothetical protein GCM10007971_32530 [Oceanobacillus indicireducens]
MDHPMVAQIERTGYPFSDRRNDYGVDGLGNEVFTGDEIIEFFDDFYLVEELSTDAIEIMEQHGGVYKIAK